MFAQTIVLLSYTLNTLIFIRVILSWLGNHESNAITRFFYDATEPILNPIRKALPHTGMLDLSPLIAFLLIDIIKNLLLQML